MDACSPRGSPKDLELPFKKGSLVVVFLFPLKANQKRIPDTHFGDVAFSPSASQLVPSGPQERAAPDMAPEPDEAAWRKPGVSSLRKLVARAFFLRLVA